MYEIIVTFIAIISCLGDIANAFICTEKGVFANTDSNDCKTFVSCGAALMPSVLDCHRNTYYWPEKKGCFSQYDCATSSFPGNKNPCEGFSNSESIPDKLSADCSKFLVCESNNIYVGDSDYVTFPQVYSQECPSGTTFIPGRGCGNYQCSKNYQCTAEGYFENPDDKECMTVVICSKFSNYHGTTSFLFSYLYTCPPNTKYSPFTNKCDAFYNCDGVEPHGGIDLCFQYNYYNPLVPNPYENDCSSYIECQEASSRYYDDKPVGVILKRECPENTFFSPIIGKCYNDHDCNNSCSKDPCSSGVGKYVDYKSGHCEIFIECRDESKTLEVYKPTYEKRYCPPGTRYSPETSECSRQYVCPTFPVNYCYSPISTTTASPPTEVAG